MVWEEAISGCRKRPPQIPFAHIPETCDCWNTMCSSAVMCLAETAKQNNLFKWQRRQEQSQNAPTRPDLNEIRSNVNRIRPPGPTYWRQPFQCTTFGSSWIYWKFLMLVRNKQSMWHGGRQTIPPICFLPAFPPSVCRFGPERRARPAAKASASTSPCRHGWRHTRTHAHARGVKNLHFSRVRRFACALRAPVQTHSYSVSRALLPMKEPPHTCTHRVRLRHNRAPMHTLALHVNKNACMRWRLSLASQACPIFKTFSTPTHILPCLDTPTAAHVRAAVSRGTPCRGCKAGSISQVKYLDIWHLCQGLSLKLLATPPP